MWIKTQKGNLVNLDKAASVILSTNMDREKPYSIHVFFGEDSVTVFSGTKDQCRDVMDEIGMFLTITYINSLNKHKPE